MIFYYNFAWHIIEWLMENFKQQMQMPLNALYRQAKNDTS